MPLPILGKNLINKFINNLIFFIPFIFLFIVIFIHFYIFNYSYAPITEGWFHAYSQLLDQGKVVYKDFYFYLTPLYLHIFNVFSSIFSDSIFSLRIFGFFINVGILFLIYIILKNFFRNNAAFFGAITSFFYYQSGVAFISYDFTQVLTLFLLISLSIMFFIVDKKNNNYLSLILSYLLGIFSFAVFFIKQSNGSFVLISIFLSLITFIIFNKDKLKLLIPFFCGLLTIVVPYTIYFYLTDSLYLFFKSIYIDAIQMKGGHSNIFLSWVKNSYLNKVFWLQIRDVFLFIFKSSPLWILFFFLGKKLKCQFLNSYYLLFIFSILISSVLSLIYFLKIDLTVYLDSFNFYNNYLIPLSLLLLIFIFVYSFILLFFKYNHAYLKLFIFSLFNLFLLFGNGTSAGLSEVGVFLLFAFLVSFLINNLKLNSILIIAFCFFQILFFATKKYQNPYNWWGISEPSVFNSQYKINHPLYYGITISSKSKVLYDVINSYSYDLANRDIYTFPNIPIFYRIYDSKPQSKAVVQWFDFINDHDAIRDHDLLMNKKPDYIFFLDLPDIVFDTHERLFRNGAVSGQRQIRQDIKNLLIEKSYFQVDNIDLMNEINLRVLKKNN